MSGVPLTFEQWLQSLIPPPSVSSGSSNAINIADFGLTTTGDNTPALHAALDACVAQGKRIIEFPCGTFGFDTAPRPINGIMLRGQGLTSTYLVRKYSGNFLNFGGGFLGGGGCSDMGVLAGAGTSGGYGIYCPGQTAVGSNDWGIFKHLYISSAGGTWAVPFMIDGQLRSSPQGTRDLRILGVDCFAGTSAGMWIANGVGVTLDSVGTYPAGGTNGDLVIGSGSTVINMSNMNIQGTLNLSNCSKIAFTGHMNNFSAASTASGVFANGTRSASGTYSNAMVGGSCVMNLVPV